MFGGAGMQKLNPAPAPGRAAYRLLRRRDRRTESTEGKQEALLAFLPNSSHFGEKERERKENREKNTSVSAVCSQR